MTVKRLLLRGGRGLLTLLLSLLVLSAAVFWISRLAPGDPLVSYYGERAERLTPAERAWAEERLGLNDPIAVQYLRWLEGAARGEFGISYQYKMGAAQVIGERLGNTLLLGGLGCLLIGLGALLLGLLCAWREGGLADQLICGAGTALSCVPEFWLSLVLILVFSVTLRWLPSSGAWSVGGSGGVWDRAVHLILPLSAVVLGHLWYYAYLVRNQLLEEVRADYVLLARAKGLGRGRVLAGHCLRNGMPACLSAMAVSVPHILGGTYVVETVFSYPGIGTLAYESARYKDYNLLMLLCLLSGGLVILCSMAAQLVNEDLDPRIRDRDRGEIREVMER